MIYKKILSHHSALIQEEYFKNTTGKFSKANKAKITDNVAKCVKNLKANIEDSHCTRD